MNASVSSKLLESKRCSLKIGKYKIEHNKNPKSQKEKATYELKINNRF